VNKRAAAVDKHSAPLYNNIGPLGSTHDAWRKLHGA